VRAKKTTMGFHVVGISGVTFASELSGTGDIIRRQWAESFHLESDLSLKTPCEKCLNFHR
jgi:hypothetical protein